MQRILSIMICGIILGCNSREKNQPETNLEVDKKVTGKEIVLKLEKLGFFDLTDQAELEIAKKEMIDSKDRLNYFSGTMRGETLDFIDNRFFWIDCEELFEIGGLTLYLKKVKPTFEKLYLKFEFINEESEQIENYWKHTIEINDKKYSAFDDEFSEAVWEIAFANFIEMLNDQLKLQNSDNRFYPIRCGNDGQMVLLTKEQFELVQDNFPNDFDHPTTLEAWKQKIGL